MYVFECMSMYVCVFLHAFDFDAFNNNIWGDCFNNINMTSAILYTPFATSPDRMYNCDFFNLIITYCLMYIYIYEYVG